MSTELNAEDLRAWPVFSFLPAFDRVAFRDFIDEKIQCYELTRKEGVSGVLVLAMIRADEKFYWESCRELIERSLQGAAALVSGVYRFDLLNFDARGEINAFRDQELAQLLANHARLLTPGAQRFIKYSSCFGILKKLLNEDWGKMVMRSGVEVFNKDAHQLDLVVRRVLRAAGTKDKSSTVIIHDLSHDLIFSRANDEQQQRLAKLFGGQANLFDRPPAVYINDGEHFIDLGAQFGWG